MTRAVSSRAGDGSHPTPSSSSRGGRRRVEGLTEAILDATIKLALEEGVDAVTLEAIATRAGVGRPTIYRRWRSKDALLEEALTQIFEQYKVDPNTGNVRDDLVIVARRTIEYVQGSKWHLFSLFYAFKESHLAPELIHRAKEHNAGIVRRGIERGELHDEVDPYAVHELIMAMIWYQITVRRQRLTRSYAEKVVDLVLDSLWA